jgi:acyl-CoA dehydrogenase
MSDRSFLQWPFFDDFHRDLADRADEWARPVRLAISIIPISTTTCKAAGFKALGDAGWLQALTPSIQPMTLRSIDVRSLCILRETLARHDGLADFAFAMQGLGNRLQFRCSGRQEQKTEWLSLTT